MSRSSTRTPLAAVLRRVVRRAAHARRAGAPPIDELVEIERELRIERTGLSRRSFLKGGAAAAAFVAGGGLLDACRTIGRGEEATRVAIVGAGLAGLNAARLLRDAGVPVTVYEAGSRVGGRTWSAHDLMGPGLTTELGGEFIDSSHTEMLDLARTLGLELLDTRNLSEGGLVRDAFFVDGVHRSEREVIEAMTPFIASIARDAASIPEEIGYAHDGAWRSLDTISLADYFARLGIDGWLLKILETAYIGEYGLEIDRQSALNFITLASTDLDYSDDGFAPYGESDERYKIVGGNDQVARRLAERLGDRVRTGYRLESLRARSGSGYTLSFARDAGTVDVHADIVVLALPFTLLRTVELDRNLALPAAKGRAIAELGYGTNAKMLLGMNERVWRSHPFDGRTGFSGYLYSDLSVQTGWDHTHGQPGTAGGYTVYLGGNEGVRAGSGTVAEQAAGYAAQLNRVWSGFTGARNDRAERFHWPTHPLARGSYACYTVGQWSTIAGAEGEPVGNLFFAGEHCSLDYQGFMNGAAESGRVAAESVLKVVGVRN